MAASASLRDHSQRKFFPPLAPTPWLARSPDSPARSFYPEIGIQVCAPPRKPDMRFLLASKRCTTVVSSSRKPEGFGSTWNRFHTSGANRCVRAGNRRVADKRGRRRHPAPSRSLRKTRSTHWRPDNARRKVREPRPPATLNFPRRIQLLNPKCPSRQELIEAPRRPLKPSRCLAQHPS